VLHKLTLNCADCVVLCQHLCICIWQIHSKQLSIRKYYIYEYISTPTHTHFEYVNKKHTQIENAWQSICVCKQNNSCFGSLFSSRNWKFARL